jgi:hypothetical protein
VCPFFVYIGRNAFLPILNPSHCSTESVHSSTEREIILELEEWMKEKQQEEMAEDKPRFLCLPNLM